MERIDYINKLLQDEVKLGNIKTDGISDGYHTFGEIYKHRIHLFISLCKKIRILKTEGLYGFQDYTLIKSKNHFDGSEMEGWFIVQIETEQGQISYHLPNEYWDKCGFAENVELANEWDGHTSDDVLERLLKI